MVFRGFPPIRRDFALSCSLERTGQEWLPGHRSGAHSGYPHRFL